MRLLCRLALFFFIRRRFVEGLNHIPADRPVLLAANHPNSFFDAVIIGSHLRRPIHTLARADVFKKPLVALFLRGINLIPVFRVSEGGRASLSNNDQTFDECQQVFKKNGIVVIFAEGICLNQTQLLPLKKGAARIAQRAWTDPDLGQKLIVVPTGLWYSSFQGADKSVSLRFGSPIQKQDFEQFDERMMRTFNDTLVGNLQTLIEPPKAHEARKPRTASALTMVAGQYFYQICARYAQKLTARTVFHDSVLFGILLFAYPLYVLFLSGLVGMALGWGGFAVALVGIVGAGYWVARS